jgi:pantothenate kinase-related protein Tda10
MSEKGDSIYLNIHEPFCGVMVGVQGAGKSHTTNCIMENCMIKRKNITKIQQPLSTLVFHYDQVLKFFLLPSDHSLFFNIHFI